MVTNEKRAPEGVSLVRATGLGGAIAAADFFSVEVLIPVTAANDAIRGLATLEWE